VLDVEFISFFIKVIPLGILLISWYLFKFFYKCAYPFRLFTKKQNYFYSLDVFLFFNKKMFIDNLINLYISFFFFRLSYKIFTLFDKGIIEILGPFKVVIRLLDFNTNFCNLFCSNFKKSIYNVYFILIFILVFYLVFTCIFYIL
jgi:hypothetical protein